VYKTLRAAHLILPGQAGECPEWTDWYEESWRRARRDRADLAPAAAGSPRGAGMAEEHAAEFSAGAVH
jgi:hypothetical protein